MRRLAAYAALTLLLGGLFTYWTVEALAIEHARSCPATCLTWTGGRVVDTDSGPTYSGRDGHESGWFNSATIELDSGRQIDVDMNLRTGEPVEVGLWHRTPVAVNWSQSVVISGTAWLHDGWPRTFWKFWLVPPLFAIFVVALFTLVQETAARARGETSQPGCLPLLAGGLALLLAVLANFALALFDWFPAWWWAALTALLAALSLSRRARTFPQHTHPSPPPTP